MARRIVVKKREPDPDALTPTQPAIDNGPVFVGVDKASVEEDVTAIQRRVMAPGISMADAVSAFSRAASAATFASNAFRASNNSPNLSNIPRDRTEVFSRREVSQAVDSFRRNPNVFTLSLESVEIDRNIRDLSTNYFFRFVVNGEGYNLEVPVADSYRPSRDAVASDFMAEGEPAVRRAMAEILNTQLMPQMLNVIGRVISERMRR